MLRVLGGEGFTLRAEKVFQKWRRFCVSAEKVFLYRFLQVEKVFGTFQL